MRATSGAHRRRPSPFPRRATSAEQATTSGSKRRRYLGGLSALAVAAGATALFATGGSAIAEGDDTLVFNGGCGLVGIGNSSKPDKSEMSVEAGDKVTFVNDLKSKATLHLDSDEVSIDKGEQYTTSLSEDTEAYMAPGCLTNPDLLKDVEVATLTVSPASDRDDDSSSGGGDNGSSGGGDNGSSGGNDGASGGGSSDGSDGDVGVPDGGNPLDDAEDPTARDAVPSPDDDAASDDEDAAADDEAAAPGGAEDGDGSGTVEAVDAASAGQDGASGLLALLATVSLIGVGVAAVRSFAGTRSAAAA